MFRREKGFTLIELIMVIVLLGLLAAVAIPQFTNLSTQANIAAEQGVVGGVRSGIYTWHANALANGLTGAASWPSNAVLCTNGNAAVCTVCFSGVLEQGGLRDTHWNKTSANTWTGPTGTTYTYTTATGTFA